MISVSEKAASHVHSIMEEKQVPSDYHLRVSVVGGGCSGLSYSLAFDNEMKEGDEKITENGVSLVVDGKSLLYLAGTVLDFSDGLNGKGFVFNNPNASRTCGCGESFSV
ncbi:MAG: iron-sulfur cluster insertion protein ErpA [Bacteroidetes bacterium]|nr:iron-sulfur cluster insertion protein ErpA [Bacteroidota bacterium]